MYGRFRCSDKGGRTSVLEATFARSINGCAGPLLGFGSYRFHCLARAGHAKSLDLSVIQTWSSVKHRKTKFGRKKSAITLRKA